MAYDKTRTPVRESIIANVETTLATIVSPSYASTLRFVRRWNGNVILDVPEYPCALVVPLSEQSTDDRSSIVEHTMELGVVLGLRSDTWAADMNRLLAEVRVALTLDPSRGGKAVTTRIVEETVFDADPDNTLASAQLVAHVLYRTLYEDPTTAY